MRRERDQKGLKRRLVKTMAQIVELVKLVPNPETVPITLTLDVAGYAQTEDGTYQRSWFLSDGSVAPIKKR